MQILRAHLDDYIEMGHAYIHNRGVYRYSALRRLIRSVRSSGLPRTKRQYTLSIIPPSTAVVHTWCHTEWRNLCKYINHFLKKQLHGRQWNNSVGLFYIVYGELLFGYVQWVHYHPLLSITAAWGKNLCLWNPNLKKKHYLCGLIWRIARLLSAGYPRIDSPFLTESDRKALVEVVGQWYGRRQQLSDYES